MNVRELYCIIYGMKKRITHTIKSSQESVKLKDYLSRELSLSRREITRLHHERSILVNGETTPLTQELKKDDTVQVIFVKETEMPDDIDILYEDEDIVVVNKPAGISAHKQSEDIPDMGILLKKHYGEGFTVRPMGRLDRYVSGIMLYAKNRKAAAMIAKEREEEILHKEYLAFCGGIFTEKSGVMEYTLGKEQGNRGRTITEDGQKCITEYEVIEDYGSYSLVKVVIRTGRTHQIRAGMAAAGHALLGDSLYHGNTNQIRRPALHCAFVSFRRPGSDHNTEIRCPLPEDMQKLKKAGGNRNEH